MATRRRKAVTTNRHVKVTKLEWRRALVVLTAYQLSEHQWASDEHGNGIDVRKPEQLARAVALSAPGVLYVATRGDGELFTRMLREYCMMLEELGHVYDPLHTHRTLAPPPEALRKAFERLATVGLPERPQMTEAA
jgi:hypothetical protein